MAKALITGASSGIGATYADRLARRGYDLILVARDRARMETLADRLGRETGVTTEIIAADLTQEFDLAAVEKTLAEDPDISLLLNNAGMSLNGGILDTSPDDLSRLIALNVTATTRLASAAGKAFVTRNAGAIINMASVLALAPERFDGVYSGSKAFLLNLSLSLSATLTDKGVQVQVVLPGATRTEIWARSGKDVDALPQDWVMSVDDLVDAALIGFDRREAVTIPPLPDEGEWTAYTAARLAMGPNLSNRVAAERYREAASV